MINSGNKVQKKMLLNDWMFKSDFEGSSGVEYLSYLLFSELNFSSTLQVPAVKVGYYEGMKGSFHKWVENVSEGWDFFGRNWEDNIHCWQLLPDWRRAYTDLLFFDTLLGNCDRHEGNLLISFMSGLPEKVFLIDHGYCSGRDTWEGFIARIRLIRRAYPVDRERVERNLTALSELRKEGLQRLLSNIPSEFQKGWFIKEFIKFLNLVLL